MAEFEHENRAEEDRCLEQARKIIKLRRDTNRDVAAMIIEPISSYQNAMATPYFYR
jgi:4-aminobutyrate aminotransferase-like enzyme